MQEIYNSVLNGGLIICAIMMVIWVFRIRSSGTTAYLMLSAFTVMGILLFAIRSEADRAWIITLSILLGILLILDMLVRFYHQAEPNK